MTQLRIEALHKAFGELVVTDNVCLTIEPGERHAIIGPNGAGKTSLINQIGGQLQSDSGHIRWGDREISGLHPEVIARAGVSRTFQRNNLFSGLSVIENIRLALEIKYGNPLNFYAPVSSRVDLLGRAFQVLRSCNLDRRALQPVAELSYGDQRQLEVAVALAAEPQLILLDEPTSGMSPVETNAMIGLISAIPRTVSLVMIEHDMKVVFSVADRVTVLYYGKVLATGTPDQIRSDRRVHEVYLGETDGATA
jgi:branched-chain amino acid transport system ATP-binding protein